eukprot:g77496.t1
MWMAAWQEKYLRQNVCKRNFHLDGTGQVNQYGYTLYSLLMVSESCKKGENNIWRRAIGRDVTYQGTSGTSSISPTTTLNHGTMS